MFSLNSNFVVYTTSTGQKEEVTTEEFLNYLVDIGKLPIYTIIERKMLCSWSYAENKVLSDTPVKISLAGCFIELYGRYAGKLSSSDNNFIMRLTGTPTVMSAYTNSKNKVYVFRAVGGSYSWTELSS